MVKEETRLILFKRRTLSLFISLIVCVTYFFPEPVCASEPPSAGPVDSANHDQLEGTSVDREPTTREEGLFSRAYGRLLWRDTTYLLSAPARWEQEDWINFSLKATVVGGAFLLDRHIQERVQGNRNQTRDRIADIFEPFGAEYSVAVLGGFYVAGVAFDNPKAEAVTRDGLAATLVASGIITPTIKIVAGRNRPAESDGVYDFHPFRFLGDNSFPSGHTTQAFAVASVIATHYDPLWVKGAAYTIAALVGFARIEHNAHWASDVAAGAFIGSAVGSATVRFNEKQEGVFSLRPLIDRDRRGMALVLHF